MIGLDTNVLVRFITNDDEQQAKKTKKLIEQYAGKKHSLFINNIVLCEVIWVLKRGYKYEKKLIIKILEQLVSVVEFCFENIGNVQKAIQLYAQGSADFSDYLIAAINQSQNCEWTFTFDKKAKQAFG